MKTGLQNLDIRRICRGSLAGALLLSAAACAHNPPQELVKARHAFREAEEGVAAQQAPAQVHTAKTALEQAEQSFAENGSSEHTRDLAYVALRKAQLASVEGRVQYNRTRYEQLKQSMEQRQEAQLEQLRDKYAAQQQDLAQSQEALEDARRRAQQAAADLERIASVKQDPRGTVITLTGEVLFKSEEAELLPGAEQKLDQVARALTQQNRNARIVVEGHTDSQGTDSYNLDLSRRRAEAVRSYLTAHGVAEDRITAKGMGEEQPIGDNSTPHGRANNRRVEIVVKPVQEASAS